MEGNRHIIPILLFFFGFFLYILYLDLFHSVAVTFIVVVAIKIDITWIVIYAIYLKSCHIETKFTCLFIKNVRCIIVHESFVSLYIIWMKVTLYEFEFNLI